MVHAYAIDGRIRPTLVAASMLHVPAKGAFAFTKEVFPTRAEYVVCTCFRVPWMYEGA